MEELRHFVIRFFTYFGSELSDEGEQIAVKLPEDLGRFFEREEIKIAFHPHHLSDDADLVTHGSYLLNRIYEYLSDHGIATFVELPKLFGKQVKIPSELNFPNSIIEKARTRSEGRYCFIFNFKIDYVSDEKLGQLYSICIDANGRQWKPPRVDLKFSEAKHIPSADLHEAYETVQVLVESHVKRQSVEIEKDILQRLFRQITRLDVFYSEQIADLRARRSGRGLQEIQDQIDLLQQEFQLKVDEETENHRLQVKLKLISYQIWKIPYLIHNLTLKLAVPEKKLPLESTELSFHRNLYNGQLEPTSCKICNLSCHTLFLCQNGHVACENHAFQCVECGIWECQDCGIAPCRECGSPVCSRCGGKCQVCGKFLCHTHRLSCHIDREAVCQDCSTICKDCRQITCPNHIERCSTCRQPVCQNCLRECSFCYAHVCQEHTYKCEVCGQIFCSNCIRSCLICGKAVCRSHSWECQQCGKSFCREDCAVHSSRCVVEEEEICIDCLKICDVCGHPVCSDHSIYCEKCNKTYCQNEAVKCYQCRKIICPIHYLSCQGCGHHICEKDISPCLICEEIFCNRCIDKKGRCPFCQQFRFAQPIELPEVIEVAKLPLTIRKCTNWRKVISKRYQILLGFHREDVYVLLFDLEGQLIRQRTDNFAKIMQIMMNY